MGHISQILTRNSRMDILKAFSWEAYISLSQESIEQLSFCKAYLGKLNIKDIFESHKCSKIVYSDGSSTGITSCEINTVSGISHGVWTSEESAKSSTWREVMAVCRCLGSWSNVLAYQRVKWFSDNKGVTLIVHKGQMKKELGILGQVWCLIVAIPDLCPLSYFQDFALEIFFYLYL